MSEEREVYQSPENLRGLVESAVVTELTPSGGQSDQEPGRSAATWLPDTKPRITATGSYLVGQYEPGNGTRYTAVAIRWRSSPDLVMGRIGVVSDGWLLVSGNSGRAYLFQRYGPLVDDYIQDHLGGSAGDYPYFGDLVRALIGRP